jgi:hypothetical protein
LYGTIGIAKPVPYEFSDEEITALTRISEAIWPQAAGAAHRI